MARSTSRITLPATAHSVGAARRFAVRACHRWGAAAAADDVALVTSELATNAYLHGARGFTLTLTRGRGHVRVETVDDNRVDTGRRESAPATRTEHALRVVAALAAEWGTASTEDRKAVWADVALPGAGHADEGTGAAR